MTVHETTPSDAAYGRAYREVSANPMLCNAAGIIERVNERAREIEQGRDVDALCDEIERDEALAGELRRCVPTNWCDALLTGPDGIGKPPYDCRTIEHLLRGILKDMDAAIDAVGGRGDR